ncbi:MAG: protein translocase subunit SecF, partial [Gammaproteobacteria bacterium]|nr:protein translocase subunit SecF [Gammaproteobacteria bacterium]
MQIIREGLGLDFMGRRRLATLLSGVLILVSLLSLATLKLNPGIDFTGGTLIEVGYAAPAELKQIRTALDSAGLNGAIVQHFGTVQDVLIRLAPRVGMKSAELSSTVLATLQSTG